MNRISAGFASLARTMLGIVIGAGLIVGPTACCSDCDFNLATLELLCCEFVGFPGCTYEVAYRADDGSFRMMEVVVGESGFVEISPCEVLIFDSLLSINQVDCQ